MTEHYFSERQASPYRESEVKGRLRGEEFVFTVASGVFSIRGIDKGTRLLVDRCVLPEKGSILDLGCGYGVVGVVIGKLFPGLSVTMADINKRAVGLARKNAARYAIEKVAIKRSDLYEALEEKYDAILLNPPQNAGKEVCFAMIEGAKGHLRKEGTLQLVARHNKGGKALLEKMMQVFGNGEEVAKDAGYRIYLSRCL